MARRIYVASSWRNYFQVKMINALRAAGHEVYDFRNPRPAEHGFLWSDIDPQWQSWTPCGFRDALSHPIAERGFRSDYEAMQWADTCVLVLPCGRSAHLEAGYFVGARKRLVVLLSDGEPELMYKMASSICITIDEAVLAVEGRKAGVCRVCGCTDEDCSGCIKKTGEPCYWVEPDLCSACANEIDKKKNY
jgi:hypothetical protein